MEEDNKIETEYQEDLICPYCGNKHTSEHSEGTEFYTEGVSEFTCEECDKDFITYTDVTYIYTTNKK